MPTSVQWLRKWSLRIGGLCLLIYCLVVGFLYWFMPFKPIQPLEAYAALEAELGVLSQQNAVIRGQYLHLVENKDKLIVVQNGTESFYHYGHFKIDPQTNQFEYSQELSDVGVVGGAFGRSFPKRYVCVMICWAQRGQPAVAPGAPPAAAVLPTPP